MSGEGKSGGDKTARVPAGDYRIARITADRPGTSPDARAVHLALEPAAHMPAQAPAFTLTLPAHALGAAAAGGDTVQVQRRSFGLEFARAAQPFFLVLNDAAWQELATRPL